MLSALPLFMGTRSRIYGTRVQWWARTCSNCWCGSPFTALGLEEHGFRTSTFLPPTFSSESAGLEALQRQRWYLVCVPPAPSTASGKASTVCWIAFLEGLTQSVTQCQPSGARKGPRHLVPPGVFSGCPSFMQPRTPVPPLGACWANLFSALACRRGHSGPQNVALTPKGLCQWLPEVQARLADCWTWRKGLLPA